MPALFSPPLPPARFAASEDPVRLALRRGSTTAGSQPSWSRPDRQSCDAMSDARKDACTVEWALLDALGEDQHLRDKDRGRLHRDLLKGAGAHLNTSQRRGYDAAELFTADACQWLAQRARQWTRPARIDSVLWMHIAHFSVDDWGYVLSALADSGETDHDELFDLALGCLQARFEWRVSRG
jgi:hypothetical protein